MKIAPPTFLTTAQLDEFIQRGYLTLHDCFSREAAQALTDRAFVRLGYDKNDPATWKSARVHMPTLEGFDCREFAPNAWAAMGDLLGGAERMKQPCGWSDAFIVNFHEGADRPWQPPSASVSGWHKDGDFFRHFLDSPEQGLLVLVIWSDIDPQGGGTFFAPDSIPVVARFFAERPDGVLPNDIPFKRLIGECREFQECTGRVGDVVLMHPFMLHASSQNLSGKPRFLTNPPAQLREPMRLDRSDPAEFSPVEQVILNALGVERLDFAPTGTREPVVPERVKRQQAAIEEEKRRLA